MRTLSSALLYLFDPIHPTLHHITLFHETLNKDRQDFRVRLGLAIPTEELPNNSVSTIALALKATLDLGRGMTPPLEEIRRGYGQSPAGNLAEPV